MNKENKSGKWREYWLDPLLSPRNSIYTEPSETCIHVIEYAAFEHAATKCEEAQSELLIQRKALDVVIKIGVEGQTQINRKLSAENEKLKAENEKLKSIIDKELGEKLRIAVDALKEIRDYDSGPSYAYCVGFLQEEARGVLKKIEGEK